MAALESAMALLLLSSMIVSLNSQQAYVANFQLNCSNHANDSITQGYHCDAESSCNSYLTFRANSSYDSPATIGYLLGATSSASSIASINNISSDIASFPPETLVVVPISCSCFNNTFYQHNASYTIKTSGESYFSIANNIYQGLTTCHSLIAQNSMDPYKLAVGSNVTVPLRCACPSKNQSSTLGTKYLLTYLVAKGDFVESIASTFGVPANEILDANELSSTALIYPVTPLLVPLTTEPKIIKSRAPAPPPPPPPPPPSNPPPSHHNTKWIYIGVGIGVFAFLAALGTLYLFCWPKPRRADSSGSKPPKKFVADTSSQSYGSLPVSSGTWSLPSEVKKSAVDSLTVYTFEELLEATGNFSKGRRVSGASVYRGTFNGSDAAVKIMKGDVSEEINILSKINHSNIIRLSGFCMNEGNTYMVYEYAHNGSLYDRLQQGELTWKQRVQIACDIAEALNYLHNYTYPSHVHKNLSSRNILLDADMRGKVGNMGRTRKVEEEEGGVHMTAHVTGAHGYLAGEYLENGVVTTKVDVYAFGVIMGEMISGREPAGEEMLSEAMGRVPEGDPETVSGFVDGALGHRYPIDLAMSMLALAKMCVLPDVNARPHASHLVITLNKILSSSLDYNLPSAQLLK